MNPFREKGIPLERQVRTWHQMVQPPYLKQEVDAFTRCRVILMNGIEMEAGVFSHAFARVCDDVELKASLATMRRIEHQQQNTVNWLNPADQSILETTVGYEQVAIQAEGARLGNRATMVEDYKANGGNGRTNGRRRGNGRSRR